MGIFFKIINFFIGIMDILILFLVVMMLFFSEFITLILSSEDILAILIVSISMQIISNRISIYDLKKEINKPTIKISCDDDNLKNIKDVKHARIYAISTTRIITVFQQLKDLKIKHCDIMVRYLNENHEFYVDGLEKEISEWKYYVGDRIERLDITGYDIPPDHYFVIFDDKFLATDLIYMDSKDIAKQRGRADEMFHIYPNSIETRQFINSYIQKFDNYKKYYLDKDKKFEILTNYRNANNLVVSKK